MPAQLTNYSVTNVGGNTKVRQHAKYYIAKFIRQSKYISLSLPEPIHLNGEIDTFSHAK